MPSTTAPSPFRAVIVHGMPLASWTSVQLLDHIRSQLTKGTGGWIVTANLDILWHFERDRAAKEVYLDADIRVADGMPLVWASKLQGDGLPERVAGSALCEPLLRICQERQKGVTLIGGNAGAAESVAERATSELPGLAINADSQLRFSVPPTPEQLDAASALINALDSRVVLVGLGSPKQEHVIQPLRMRHPRAWFIGVGGSFSFMAGDVARAPRVLQNVGLEWVHRLSKEPRRLAERYLLNDLPLAVRMLTSSAIIGLKRRL